MGAKGRGMCKTDLVRGFGSQFGKDLLRLGLGRESHIARGEGTRCACVCSGLDSEERSMYRENGRKRSLSTMRERGVGGKEDVERPKCGLSA
jgi:hypothetical protein